MSSIKIYVAHHKKDFVYKSDVFQPIQVGKELSNVNLGILCDNQGENISFKNRLYSEMTAVYWAWKNDQSAEYVGLCHYRRYFAIKKQLSLQNIISFVKHIGVKSLGVYLNKGYLNYYSNNIIINNEGRFLENIRNFEGEIQKHNFDILLTCPIKLSLTNVGGWFSVIGMYFMQDLRKILEDDYPDYVDTYDDVLKGNSLSICNMFVMKKNIYNKYCEFIFDVLLKHERIYVSDINDVNKSYFRISGYLAEVLTNVFVENYINNNMCKVEYVKMMNIEI